MNASKVQVLAAIMFCSARWGEVGIGPRLQWGELQVSGPHTRVSRLMGCTTAEQWMLDGMFVMPTALTWLLSRLLCGVRFPRCSKRQVSQVTPSQRARTGNGRPTWLALSGPAEAEIQGATRSHAPILRPKRTGNAPAQGVEGFGGEQQRRRRRKVVLR